MCPVKDKLIAGLENSDTGTGMKKVAKLQVHVHRYTCTNKQHICNQVQKYMLTHISILQSGHAVISPPQAGPEQLARKDQSSQDDRNVGQGLLRSPHGHRHINGQDAHRPGGADPYGRTDQEGLRHNITCLQIISQIVSW